MINYLKLTFFQLRKKSNIINAILVSLAILVVIGSNSYKKMYNNFQLNDSKNYLATYMLQVDKREDLTNEENYNTLKNIENVTNISYMYEFSDVIHSDLFKTDKFSGDIQIYNSSNESLPEIVKGTNFPDNDGYYMVCPINFYPESLNNIKYYSKKDNFNLDSYLGKEIVFDYNGYMFSRNLDDKYKFEIPIKLVGLYKNANNYYDESECYVNKKTIHDITKNEYTDLEEDYVYQINHPVYALNVSSYEEVEKVEMSLEKSGYNYNRMFYFDENETQQINNTADLVYNIAIVIIFIFIFLVFQKDYYEDKEYYRQLNVLGFNLKEIKIIYFISLLIKVFVYFLFVLVITIISMLVIKILTINYPFILSKLRVLYSFDGIASVILIFIFNVLLSFMIHRHIGKLNV